MSSAAFAAACSSTPPAGNGGTPDSGTDSAAPMSDAGHDTGASGDSGHDTGTSGDGGRDSGSDATVPVDGGLDSGTDAGTGDAGTDAAQTDASADAATVIVPNHVFVIMMENNGTQHILHDAPDAAPYIVNLSNTVGYATDYFGVTHPSEPNYIAAISGQTFGQFDDDGPGATAVLGDLEFVPGAGDGTDYDGGPYLSADQLDAAVHAPHWYGAPTIVDELETAHKTWRAYMESMTPGNPQADSVAIPVNKNDAGYDAGTTASLYKVKHNPFAFFSTIAGNVVTDAGADGGSNPRLANIVPFSQFAADLATDAGAKGIANFVWITPNMCNDMHGVSGSNPDAGIPAACDSTNIWSGPNGSAVTIPALLTLGDTFVKNTVEAIKASPAWSDNSAIVIVWDEDEYLSNAGAWSSPTNGTDGGIQGGGKVVALVETSYSTGPKTFALPANHYTLLATLENLWGLPCTGNACGVADAGLLMTPLFQP